MTVYRDTEEFTVPKGMELFIVGCHASDIDNNGHTYFEVMVTCKDRADALVQVQTWLDDPWATIVRLVRE